MKPFEKSELPRMVRTPDHIEDEAAAWADLLRDCRDPETFWAFERWRAADPAHAKAFDSIDSAYRTVRSVGESRALSDMENETMGRVAAHARRNRRRLGAMLVGLAASIVAVIGITGGSLHEMQYLRDRAVHMLAGESLYRTAVGERLTVALDDGSLLTLNTDSRAVVKYRDNIRGVTLLAGQALFEVAKSPNRPFVVTAGTRTVTAVGTAFDVRLSDSVFEVTMLEGSVVVEPQQDYPKLAAASKSSAATRTELGAGEQFIVTDVKKAPVIRKTDPRRATSWREGQIIFENDALAYAVSELNRYGRRHLVLSDPRLANLRVSGAFNTSNTGVFIDMLTVHLPVRVDDTGDDSIVLSYAGS